MNSDHKGLRIVGFILIGIGSFFAAIGVLAGGLFLFVTLVTSSLLDQQDELEDFMKYAVETTGTVIEASDGHTIVGYYDEDDIWHEAEISVYYGRYKEGSDITVYYDEEKPEKCMVPELVAVVPDIIAPVLYGVGGVIIAVFLMIGSPMIIGGIVLVRLKKKTEKTD